MKKINKLTEAQISKMSEYVSVWTAKGLTTSKKSHDDAVRDFTSFQQNVLKMEKPAPVVLLNSPTECWMAVIMSSYLDKVDVIKINNQVENQVRNQVGNQVMNQVWNQVRNQVGNQVMNQVRDQVRNQVENQVRGQVRGQVWNQVENQVENQVMNQVMSQVWNQVMNQVMSQVWNQVGNQKIIYPYFDCQFWATYFSYYEFMRHELGVKFNNTTEYESFFACHSYGMVWPTSSLCVVCQPPSVIKKNSRGLHCEDGPAVSYSGLNEIYALNGITVPKELVMTPAEDLSIEIFKSEKNADVKAEFVRKYGIERMLDMGKLVDTFENYPDQARYDWWWKSQYELHDMSAVFTDIPYQPYLKMMNQTTKIWHMEAVSPICRTLKDAIKERFGGREMKIVAIA